MGLFGARRKKRAKCVKRGCGRVAVARRLCARHYQAEYRTYGPPCRAKGCATPSFSRGLCVRHYQAEYRATGPRCRKRNCQNPAFARKLCVKHYHRWYQARLAENHVERLGKLKDRSVLKAA